MIPPYKTVNYKYPRGHYVHIHFGGKTKMKPIQNNAGAIARLYDQLFPVAFSAKAATVVTWERVSVRQAVFIMKTYGYGTCRRETPIGGQLVHWNEEGAEWHYYYDLPLFRGQS